MPFEVEERRVVHPEIHRGAGQGRKDLATLKGKVWEKGKDEPKDWTVTFDDPARPYTHGAGGLYGLRHRHHAEGARIGNLLR